MSSEFGKDPTEWKADDWPNLPPYKVVHVYADYRITCLEPLPSPGRDPEEKEGWGTVFIGVYAVREARDKMGRGKDILKIFKQKLDKRYRLYSCTYTLARLFYHKYL